MFTFDVKRYVPRFILREKNGYALRGVIYLLSGAERVAYEKLL